MNWSTHSKTGLDALWQAIKARVTVLDWPLMLIFMLLFGVSIAVQHSAALDFSGRIEDHIRNLIIALLVMGFMANVRPSTLMQVAIPAYLLGVLLLIAVALFGDVSKGARRWLNLGFTRIQPSEIMKIGMPLMLAWYFHQREQAMKLWDFAVAALLLLIPVALIVKQPDLGTAILVLTAGFYVIFFAGLSWRILFGLIVIALASMPVIWQFMLHDYQKQRILTLLDPTSDPLGKGFHIIQSTIAVGSGGLYGKGWMKGTQTHLEFVPERTTDFIFAVFSEEFGFMGNSVLIVLYTLLIARGLTIAAYAPTAFGRLLAGSVTMIYFTYAFVNMGMVTGILPVVGVPLPMMSYGGTAMVTLGLGAGILMAIQHQRRGIDQANQSKFIRD
jgi:rod shape determining protein RodA